MLDYVGRTALHYAADAGDLEILTMITQHVARQRRQKQATAQDSSPIDPSAPISDEEIKTLAGDFINTQDQNGRTALHEAAKAGK